MERRQTIGKVKARELAIHLLGGTVEGERGFNLGSEIAQITMSYCGFKSIAARKCPFELAPGTMPAIAHILCLRTDAQVTSSIIQSVSVNVIDNFRISRVQKKSVQEEVPSSPATIAVYEIRIINNILKIASRPMEMPADSRNYFNINIVDKNKMPARKMELSHE